MEQPPQESADNTPELTREDRQKEKDNLVKQREEENIFSKKIRELKELFIKAEKFIGARDMAIFRSARYSDDEIHWIAEVKKASQDNNPGQLNAYDLVRMSGMLARDFYKFGPDLISDQTEDYLDEILAKIKDRYDNLFKTIDQVGLEKMRDLFIDVDDQYKAALADRTLTAKNAKDKAALISKWLNIVHRGGNREMVAFFYGYPQPSQGRGGLKGHQADQQEFLNRLNNLGYRLQQKNTPN
ncbi:MAG: hypothetical protein A2928_01000 [Candidatus Taylorbacteria bacterium RIFCSPLOWO2_01_FULL_45_15b]|uniref:Uncharacterized protein n=1 Tax=Candidatus Taylorbacteria bacterium RIFCSPLOWO2_01_FULL_45_15b TaxID=1802319 RepID=A0A1G2N7Y1_9BACT|nr:MAG: hypothetical protein A2928_01000 [Candidatus Taylorbacteria bacterium RIFCSPLOWO2_01_FULL_45_15b]